MTNDNRMDVFDVVHKYVTSTQYIVIPRLRMKEELNGKYALEELDASLTVLQLNGLLHIGFTDAECYCLALTEKGIREGEIRDAARQEAERLEAMAREQEEKQAEKTPPTLPKEETPVTTVVKEVASLTKRDKWTFALLCCGSAFLGGLLAGIVTMIVLIVKAG